MKLNPFCMCCAINKQEKKIRDFDDADRKTEYMKKVMELMANAGEDDCAPSISIDLKKMFQTVENIIHLIDKDDMSKYLLFLEDVFPYMEKYHYQKGMKEIIRELKQLLKGNNHGTSSDRALLLDYQATMETKPEKAIKLEKEALAQIKETTDGNAHLVSNLHANLGGLYRINGQTEFAKGHMEKGILLLEQYKLLYTNDSIPQINNYAA